MKESILLIACGMIQDVDFDESLIAYQRILEEKKSVKIEKVDLIARIASCEYCK